MWLQNTWTIAHESFGLLYLSLKERFHIFFYIFLFIYLFCNDASIKEPFWVNPKTVFKCGQNSFDLFLKNASLDLSSTRFGYFS